VLAIPRSVSGMSHEKLYVDNTVIWRRRQQWQ
jgi:hypothetical protein